MYNNFDICLGLYSFSKKNLDINKLTKIINFGISEGVNYIDTADNYQNGNQQKILAKVIGKSRGQIQYINKFQLVKNYKDLEKNLDMSLKRLKTDYLDIYMPHWPSVYLDEKKLSNFANNMIKKGKIQNFGLSNFNLKLIKRFKKFFKKKLFLQNEINLNNFYYNKDLINYTLKNKVKLFAYGIHNNFFERRIKIDENFYNTDYELSLYWLKNFKNLVPIISSSKIKNLQKNIDIIRNNKKIIKRKFLLKKNYKNIYINQISKLNSQSGIIYKTLDDAKKNKKKLFPSPMDISKEIKKIGVLKPFYVKQLSNDNYELLSGQARYWAIKIIYGNLKKIPTILIN